MHIKPDQMQTRMCPDLIWQMSGLQAGRGSGPCSRECPWKWSLQYIYIYVYQKKKKAHTHSHRQGRTHNSTRAHLSERRHIPVPWQCDTFSYAVRLLRVQLGPRSKRQRQNTASSSILPRPNKTISSDADNRPPELPFARAPCPIDMHQPLMKTTRGEAATAVKVAKSQVVPSRRRQLNHRLTCGAKFSYLWITR